MSSRQLRDGVRAGVSGYAVVASASRYGGGVQWAISRYLNFRVSVKGRADHYRCGGALLSQCRYTGLVELALCRFSK